LTQYSEVGNPSPAILDSVRRRDRGNIPSLLIVVSSLEPEVVQRHHIDGRPRAYSAPRIEDEGGARRAGVQEVC